MNIQNNGYFSIEQVKDQYLNTNTKTSNLQKPSVSFQEILDLKTKGNKGELKFSKHASSRLETRNIELTNEQLDRLSEATTRAGEKGIKESLVIMDALAFIVNIPNNTVVTAMEQQQANEQIFTNIDGAIIV